MAQDPQASNVILDRGGESIFGGVVFALLAIFVFTKLHETSGIMVPEVSSLLVMSATAFWIGVKRRRYAISHGGTRSAPTVPVPPEPYARASIRLPREPVIVLMLGVLLFANGFAFGALVVATHGPLVLAILAVVAISGPGARISYIGARRLRWYRAYLQVVGEPPW